jgi:hypothetical protein
LTTEEAIGLLPDTELIHTFTPGPILIGADWTRERVLQFIRDGHVELSGDMARRMRHGIMISKMDPVASDEGWNGQVYFVQTDEAKLEAFDV